MDKIAAFTSDSVANAKVERVGKTLTAAMCGETLSGCSEEYSLVILHVKNLRKLVERGSVELFVCLFVVLRRLGSLRANRAYVR